MGRYETAKAANVYETFFRARGGGERREAGRNPAKPAAVYSANEIITSERNLSKLFARVMEGNFQLIPAHNGVILPRRPAATSW